VPASLRMWGSPSTMVATWSISTRPVSHIVPAAAVRSAVKVIMDEPEQLQLEVEGSSLEVAPRQLMSQPVDSYQPGLPICRSVDRLPSGSDEV
jgi:hypothetical protein